MPITAERRKLYGPDWARISRFVRFTREKGKCQHCGVLHGQEGFWRKRPVVITAAHIDQNPENHDDSNLLALCAVCHLNFDRKFNLRKSALTKERKRWQRQDALFQWEEPHG